VADVMTTPETDVAQCELRRNLGRHGEPCDGSACVYWRVVEHLGVEPRADEGCAIQYFELLGEEGSEIAEWLYSVKARLERSGSDE
jgi:hypothetical protein